jgi:hypothetical protein
MSKHSLRMCSFLANEAYSNNLKSLDNSVMIENKETDCQIHIGHKNKVIYVAFRGTSSKIDVLQI